MIIIYITHVSEPLVTVLSLTYFIQPNSFYPPPTLQSKFYFNIPCKFRSLSTIRIRVKIPSSQCLTNFKKRQCLCECVFFPQFLHKIGKRDYKLANTVFRLTLLNIWKVKPILTVCFCVRFAEEAFHTFCNNFNKKTS